MVVVPMFDPKDNGNALSMLITPIPGVNTRQQEVAIFRIGTWSDVCTGAAILCSILPLNKSRVSRWP